MASRLLQGNVAAAAGAAAAAAAAAARPSVALCDWQPSPSPQRLRLVQLDSSWEEVINFDDQTPLEAGNDSSGFVPAAPGVKEAQSHLPPTERGDYADTSPLPRPQQWENFPSSASSNGGGSQMARISLGRPTQDESARAFDQLESMLRADYREREFDAAASMEASEAALQRAWEVTTAGGVDDGSWLDCSAAHWNPLQDSGRAVMAFCPLPAAAPVRKNMLSVLNKHGPNIRKIVASPTVMRAVWVGLNEDDAFQSILKDEGLVALGDQDHEGNAGEKFSLPKNAAPPPQGSWNFFTVLQDHFLQFVERLRGFFHTGFYPEPEVKRGDGSGGANAMDVIGGVAAIVVAVVLLVLMARIRR